MAGDCETARKTCVLVTHQTWVEWTQISTEAFQSCTVNIPMQRGRTGSTLKIKWCNASVHRGLGSPTCSSWREIFAPHWLLFGAAHRRIPFWCWAGWPGRSCWWEGLAGTYSDSHTCPWGSQARGSKRDAAKAALRGNIIQGWMWLLREDEHSLKRGWNRSNPAANWLPKSKSVECWNNYLWRGGGVGEVCVWGRGAMSRLAEEIFFGGNIIVMKGFSRSLHCVQH